MSVDEYCALLEIEEHYRANPPGPLSTREVARRLDVSHGTVQNIERRALDKLRKLVKSGWAP